MISLQYPPLPHQIKVLSDYSGKDKKSAGWFLDMGLGKTYCTFYDFAELVYQDEVDGLLVLAPNLVHENWMNEAIKHIQDPFGNVVMAVWRTGKKKAMERCEACLNSDLPAMVFMNIQSIRTDAGFKFIKRFLEKRKTYWVIDESTDIKSPRAIQAKRCVLLREKAKYRRILSGTPMTNNVLDAYMQLRFLDPDITLAVNFASFKAMYAVITTITTNSGARFEKIERFQNIDKLNKLVEPHVIYMSKEDHLDLPEKIRSTHTIDLSPEQERATRNLTEFYIHEFEKEEKETGQVSVQSAATLVNKLHQITSGFMVENDTGAIHVFKDNPKLELLLTDIEHSYEKIIIYCCYRWDVENIHRHLEKHYGPDAARTLYGGDSAAASQQHLSDFQKNPETRFLVMTSKGALGLNLIECNNIFYYSENYNLMHRLQSEDRIHRIGQTKTCFYRDYLAKGSIDEVIKEAVTGKKNLITSIVQNWKRILV